MICTTPALDLLTSLRRRFVVAHVRWPSHHRQPNLECVQSYHLMKYSLVGRPEATAVCQHGKGGIWGRSWSCPCRHACDKPASHASMLPQNVEGRGSKPVR